MGVFSSRQNVGIEEVDVVANHAYKYPSRCGNYFGTHFIMGGERFDTPQPEAYLFGENADLNFLGSKPTPFPYPPPQANEPTKTLKSLVNIRKESLRFVKVPSVSNSEDEPKETKYNIEFTFDCNTRCSITIYYFSTEEMVNNSIVYTPKDVSMNSETFHYKRGANQQFTQASHVFDPSKFNEEDLSYDLEKEIIPIVIHCVAEETVDESKQAHTTIAVVEKHSDGSYVLKALKQKLFVDGLCYLLQEIYGIENKNNENNKTACDDETEDNGSECVICMCDVRDTLILPCRHLCLCNSCADSLRYQANNCPICRAPFRALLQIRALHKSSNSANPLPVPHQALQGSCENIPAGYEHVSLIEALNGPYTRTVVYNDVTETPNSESAVQAAEMLNRSSSIEDTKKQHSIADKLDSNHVKESSRLTSSNPEFRMSVLLSREGSASQSPPPLRRNSTREEEEEEKEAPDLEQSADLDSDAEKLSPLLVTKKNETTSTADNDRPLTNNHETSPHERRKDRKDGEDSDYYTPEDPAPTILSPLYERDKDRPIPSSVESTPGRWMPYKDVSVAVSLPGTPLSTSSHLSARSSGDSYSSTSSTRHLLAHNLAARQEKGQTGQPV